MPAHIPEHAGEIGEIGSKAIGASAAGVLIQVRLPVVTRISTMS